MKANNEIALNMNKNDIYNLFGLYFLFKQVYDNDEGDAMEAYNDDLLKVRINKLFAKIQAQLKPSKLSHLYRMVNEQHDHKRVCPACQSKGLH